MAKYTAIYHITISAEVEADNEDEAMEKLDSMSYEEMFGDISIEDCEEVFDCLMDEDGNEIFY